MTTWRIENVTDDAPYQESTVVDFIHGEIDVIVIAGGSSSLAPKTLRVLERNFCWSRNPKC